MTETEQVNLAPFMIVWTVFFGLIGLSTGDGRFLWMAVAPWLFLIALIASFFLILMPALWLVGVPTKLTYGNTTRVYRRGKPTEYIKTLD